MPSDRAISRWLRRSSCFSRSTSRILRMDNLFFGTLFLLVVGGPLARMEEDVATTGSPAPLLAYSKVIGINRNH